MKMQGKVWGKTQDMFKNSNFELHRIEAKKGGFCSKHKHEHKYNAFFIEKGKLKIIAYETDYDLVDETIITTGELTTVKPGVFHRFEALEDTICYEIYWVSLDQNDIVREDVGGSGNIKKK
jgi:mannose-6-phosphate isomerase-like protein (cupin superfamily)